MRPRTEPVWIIVAVLGLSILIPAISATSRSDDVPRAAPLSLHTAAGPSTPAIPVVMPHPAIHPGILPQATVILPDGALSGASAPIVISGNNYDFTADFTGGIVDERNGSTLNGRGYNLTMDANLSVAIELRGVSNVTVKNFGLENTSTGIAVEGGAGNSAVNNGISATGWAVDAQNTRAFVANVNNASGGGGMLAIYSTGVSFAHNQLPAFTTPAFEILYCSNVSVVGNNANGSSEGAIVESTTGVHLIRNNFSNSFEGIFLYGARDTVISANNFSASSYPMYLLDSVNTSGARNNGGGGSYGIYASGDSGLNLTGESFTQLQFGGLSLSGTTGASITNSSFTHSDGDGATVTLAAGVVLSGDDFSYFQSHGVSVTDSSNVLLSHDLARHGNATPSWGFYSSHDTNLTLLDNVADHSFYGAQDSNSVDLNLTGNDFSHALPSYSGVLLSQETGVVVDGNNLFNVSNNAIIAYSVNGIRITGNNMSMAGAVAVVVEYGLGATISNNSVDHAWYEEIYLYQETQITVNDNHGGSSGYANAAGLVVYNCAGGLVSGNSLQFLNQSLLVESSPDVTVLANNVSNSFTGLVILYDVGNQIVGNQVWNDQNGFEVGGNQDVWFYHNNFGNDSGWLNDSSLDATHWDNGYPSGGNFWSNLTGPDLFGGAGQSVPGSDGIVDSPFVINVTNIDRYPLAGAWTVHTATFQETGLPFGSPWGVLVAGSWLNSTGSTIVFNEPDAAANGYAYSVDPVPGYNALPSRGVTPPSTADSTVPIVFSQQLYNITFQELGLTSGTNWSVKFGTQTMVSAGGALSFWVPNGTYSYSIAPITDFALSPRSGSIVVDGSGSLRTESFSAVTYSISVVETGLPSGNWSLTWAGTSHSSTGSSIGFSAGNGSYSFIVNPVTGYNVTPASGHQTVNGTGVVLNIVFTLIPKPVSPGPQPSKGTSTAGSFPAATVYALLAALLVALALAALGFLLLARARRPPPPAPTAWAPGTSSKSPPPVAAASSDAWSEGPGDTAIPPPSMPTPPGGGPPPGAR